MKTGSNQYKNMSRDAILISKILESFEAMENTLSGLNLQEPLIITQIAKETFANAVFNNKSSSRTPKRKLQ